MRSFDIFKPKDKVLAPEWVGRRYLYRHGIVVSSDPIMLVVVEFDEPATAIMGLPKPKPTDKLQLCFYPHELRKIN